MTRRPRARVGLSILVIVAVLAGGSILNLSRRAIEGLQEQRTDGLFYTLPVPLAPRAPGTVIRRERIASAPLDSTAWRIIYHSRDQHGKDIAVSGIVVAPNTPAPKGGRTIVSWAHPTTGATAQCAPSLSVDPFFTMEGVHELLAEGFVVAATDYPGMGVAGESSYLLGVPESNSVLDAARAARTIPAAHASAKLLLWGHSQGGQAALIAAERARSYAPQLTLEGVAVAAPAADLNTLMTDDIINISGVTIASLAVPAYEAAYSDTYSLADIDSILSPEGLAATPSMANLCLLTQTKQIHAIADPLIGHYVTSDPATTEPWQTMLQQNSAGTDIRVPVFVGQGLADKLVIPTATEAYVRSLCDAGVDVSFHEFTGITHALAAYASVPALLPWLTEVDRGGTPKRTC